MHALVRLLSSGKHPDVVMHPPHAATASSNCSSEGAWCQRQASSLINRSHKLHYTPIHYVWHCHNCKLTQARARHNLISSQVLRNTFEGFWQQLAVSCTNHFAGPNGVRPHKPSVICFLCVQAASEAKTSNSANTDSKQEIAEGNLATDPHLQSNQGQADSVKSDEGRYMFTVFSQADSSLCLSHIMQCIPQL